MVQGHPIMTAGALLWSLRCGRYTDRTLKGLKYWCTGTPTNVTRLKKLREGRRPVGGHYLGELARAMGDAWWNTTTRGTNVARNRRDREVLSVVLASLPEQEATGIPFEPEELEVGLGCARGLEGAGQVGQEAGQQEGQGAAPCGGGGCLVAEAEAASDNLLFFK